MPRLSSLDARRADQLARTLGTVHDGEGPGIRAVLPELRTLLDGDVAGAYALLPRDEGLDVEYAWGRGDGFDVARFAAGLRNVLRRSPRSLSYDPFRPERAQRNRVDHRPVQASDEALHALYAEHGFVGKPRLRVLLCEGDSLLAWVGTVRTAPFGWRERALLARLVGPLRRRAILDRQLAAAPAALGLLDAAMEEIGAPAYLLRAGVLAHANAAGAAALASDRDGTLDLLHAHVQGRARGGFALTRHRAPGAPEHVLAIGRRGPADPVSRAAALARRWGLTEAQRRVLALVGTGASNKAAAATLRCAECTIEFHLTAILARAGCPSRSRLVARFWTEG
jgi:DNA-binding CsgD family transcriptional regulator